MMSLQVTTLREAPPSKASLKFIEEILTPWILPGTTLEVLVTKGEDGKPEDLFLVDILSKPIRIKMVTEARRDQDQLPKKDQRRKQESGELSEVLIKTNLSSFPLPIPTPADLKALLLPPDDWTMEVYPKGKRFLVIKPPADGFRAMDLMQQPYDSRMKILANIYEGLAYKANIGLLPREQGQFPQAYRKWQKDDTAHRLILKRRVSLYSSRPEDGSPNGDWKELTYARHTD
jgi:hypothetical protein